MIKNTIVIRLAAQLYLHLNELTDVSSQVTAVSFQSVCDSIRASSGLQQAQHKPLQKRLNEVNLSCLTKQVLVSLD